MGTSGFAIEKPGSSGAAWKKVTPILSFGIAAFCFWWVVREIDPDRLWRQVSTCHPGWIALAVVCDVLAYAAQGFRWRLLLRPLGELPLFSAAKAIYAGLFANEILPLRPGEVLRAWLAARELSIGPIALAPSIVVERLIDGVWLAFGLLLLAHSVPLPPGLAQAVRTFVTVVACLAGLAIILNPVVARLGLTRRWHVAGNLRFVPDSFPMVGAWLGSAAVLLFQALSFWFTMRACRMGLPFSEAFGVLLVVRIGTVLPGAPANLGTHQFAAVLGLMLFGVQKQVAASFSMILFAVLTIPLWLLGAAALAQSGVGLAGIRRGYSCPLSPS